MQRSKVCGFVAAAVAVLLVLGGLPLHVQAQPVHFKELMAIVAIDPPKGWEVSEKPKGTTLKTPVQMSEAEVEFRAGDDKRLEVKIIDTMAGMMSFMGMVHAMEMESSEEYIKPFAIHDFKGMENYKHKEKEGDIKLPVANRFLVSITGYGIDNTEVLKEVAGKLDLKKLAGLAK